MSALLEVVAERQEHAAAHGAAGRFPLHTAGLEDSHANSPNNGSEMDNRLKPGLLVVVAVDPVATLRPLFGGDEAIEKAAWEMFPRMRKYIAFLRDVESLEKSVANDGDELEGEPAAIVENMSPLSGTGVHLNLIHTQRPSRSRYDTIDESMSVPLYVVERPSSPTSPASLPQRQNSRRYPGLVRTPTRRPMAVQSTKGSLPWRELYAHTIMDAFAAVSDIDPTSPRNGELPSFSLSSKDMQRYDGYQGVDRARESNQYQKAQGDGGDPVDVVDDWDMEEEEEEEEDESQFRLSTVISGLTMEEDCSVLDQAKDALALSARHPPSRVASPVSSGAAPSAWKGKPIRLPQLQRSQHDYIATKDAQVPQFQEPLSPKSPTMTGISGETSDSKHTNRSSASTPTSTSLSTQVTSIPDHVSPSSPSPVECQAEETRNDNKATPWDFTHLDLGGGLGSNKPVNRRCAIHVRIWLDLGNEEPEDPRTFFEELKMLRALERTSDMHYVAQQKQANAQRVLAWRSSTTSKPIKSPSKSTLSLNNPFSSSHVKHLSSSTYHNPFKIARRRTSMPVTKSRKQSFLLSNPLHTPAFLLERRRSSVALPGAEVLAAEQTSSTISSFKKVWNRLFCRPL